MDVLESVVGRFWKREKSLKPISKAVEGRFTPRVWAYEHFREYLMALGRGRNSLLPLDQYPDLIELNRGWHEVLEDLRTRTTQHGKEHYAVIGFTEILRRISLPKAALRGANGIVPEEVIKAAHSNASRAGIDKVLGDMHSHPYESHLQFSLGDLYTMVYEGSTEFVKTVVGTDENLFVFKTKGSTTTGLAREVFTQEGFCKHWYENNGYRFLGISENGESAAPVRSGVPSVWELNKQVARKHNLVFYSGDANADLVKVFPISNGK